MYLNRRVFVIINIIITITIIILFLSFQSASIFIELPLLAGQRILFPSPIIARYLRIFLYHTSTTLWFNSCHEFEVIGCLRHGKNQPIHEIGALRTFRRVNVSVRMPGPLAKPHVQYLVVVFLWPFAYVSEKHRFWRDCVEA